MKSKPKHKSIFETSLANKNLLVCWNYLKRLDNKGDIMVQATGKVLLNKNDRIDMFGCQVVVGSRAHSMLKQLETKPLRPHDMEWMAKHRFASMEVKRRQHELRAQQEMERFEQSENPKLLISAINHFTRAAKPKEGMEALEPFFPFDKIEPDLKVRADLLMAYGRAARRYYKHESNSQKDFELTKKCGEMALEIQPYSEKVMTYMAITMLLCEDYREATSWFVSANRSGMPMKRVRSDVIGFYASVDSQWQARMRDALSWVQFPSLMEIQGEQGRLDRAVEELRSTSARKNEIESVVTFERLDELASKYHVTPDAVSEHYERMVRRERFKSLPSH